MVNPDVIFGRLGNKMFQGAYLYSQMKKGEIPDLFVQDPKYFEGCEKEVRDMYSQGVGYLPYVGIHLRVGGNPTNPSEPRYMENPFYTHLTNTGYYLKALELFPENEGWKFLVFSDDMDYAHAYFEGGRFGFDDSEDDIQAFNKFASCHHKILANSSYSWWAGFLSNMPDAKIIVPSEESWFADKVVRTKVPKEWTQISP